MELKILNKNFISLYSAQLSVDINKALMKLNNTSQSVDDFRFYTANSAVHSSNIEGNSVSFDTYLKSSEFQLHIKTKEFNEIDDLILAYQYARNNELTLIKCIKSA